MQDEYLFVHCSGIIVIIIAYDYPTNFNKRAVNELDQNEFHKGLRKAQVIDVREKVDYDYGHINGARNIPITVFKQRYQGLRNDQPIYLCDANGIASYRAARILRKMDIKIFTCLKAVTKWTGKIKSKK